MPTMIPAIKSFVEPAELVVSSSALPTDAAETVFGHILSSSRKCAPAAGRKSPSLQIQTKRGTVLSLVLSTTFGLWSPDRLGKKIRQKEGSDNGADGDKRFCLCTSGFLRDRRFSESLGSGNRLAQSAWGSR